MAHDPNDPFSRANYRSLIAWPERMKREAPFLERFLAALPDASVLDLGCGTGEHARHLAERGLRVVGLDRSPAMIESALDGPLPDNLRFVTGDMREADTVLPGEMFGGALGLGNMLPFLTTEVELAEALAATARVLKPGGVFLFQLLNYERLEGRNERALPINVRPDPGGEIVFVRVMSFPGDGRVVFYPTTLQIVPDAEEPVRLVRSKRVELRGWRQGELERALIAAGFATVNWFGTMTGEPWMPLESSDLVGWAVRG